MAEGDKKWVIINLANIDWDICQPDINRIPELQKPTIIYSNKDRAEGELLKLQEKYSLGEFVLFGSVAHAVPGLFERGVFFVEDI